jgi:hypothetical protein
MTARKGEAWNDEDYRTLRRMAADGIVVGEIAKALGRSREAISGKAAKLKIRLKS